MWICKSFRSREARGRINLIGLIGLAFISQAVVMPWMSEACAADPVVSWKDAESAATVASAGNASRGGSLGGRNGVDAKGLSFLDHDSARFVAALPPPPRKVEPAARPVQPSSLAGISATVVPAVTGDLYWSRPTLDMRIIGQSIGQSSSLRLSRPPVGVSVGTTAIKPESTKPALVGIK